MTSSAPQDGMRVCILTQYFPPEIGAPQARLARIVRGLVARGHEVTVVTAMPNYPEGRIRAGYGGLLRRESLDGARVLRTFVYPSKSLKMVRRMASYMSFVSSSAILGLPMLPRKLDYLFTESPPLFLGMSGWWLSRIKRAKWIFNVSDLWPASAVWLGVVSDGPALRMAERLEAFCYRKSWLVSCQTKSIQRDIVGRFPSVATYHLPNGADTRRDAARPERESELRSLIRAGAACIGVYAGLLGAAQQLGQTLDALARVPVSTGLRLVFVGDGPEKELLKRKAASLGLGDRALFVDPVPKEDVPALYAAADFGVACLAPMFRDAVPSKIFDVMAAGKPLLLVAQGEAVEMVGRVDAGVTVSPGDIEAIASSLSRLASDEEWRARLGANGRAAAMGPFNAEKVVAGFVEHLEQQRGTSREG